MTYEHTSETFSIWVEDPRQDGGDVRARIAASKHDNDDRGYDEEIKVTGRSVSQYVNTVAQVEDLSEDEKEELSTEILGLKNEIRDLATTMPNNDSSTTQNTSDDLKEKKWMEILQRGVTSEGENQLKMDEAEEVYDNVMELTDSEDINDGDAFVSGNIINITDKGEKKVMEFLGFESFEGDPEAKAQQILEDGKPFIYYLESFNKIHKGDFLLKIWEMSSGLSCTCADRQIHSWAVGPSGKGKSHLKRELLKFLPPESYMQKESFSPKAIQYKTQDEGTDFMDNKIVYFDEVGDNIEEAIELIRLLTDQDKEMITHETVKDQEIVEFSVEAGNITVWFTSVETIQDEQLKNRFILTNPDASSAQDKTVNEHQQQILNYGGKLDFMPKEASVVQRMVRTVRNETPEYKPIVPFKIDWKQEFNRRLYPFFYTLMGIIAKMYFRRRVTTDENIIVTRQDFELAKVVWSRLVDTTVAQTDKESLKLLRELPDNELQAVSRQTLRSRLDSFSTKKVQRKTENLEETEELQLINSKYEDGEYFHWAGADVDKLVDNEPEIDGELTEQVVRNRLEESGVEVTQEMIDSVFESEAPVLDYLEDKIDMGEEKSQGEEDVSVTEEELLFIELCKEYGWGAELGTLSNMCNEDIKVYEQAETLEEKDVVRIGGDNIPEPGRRFDEVDL